MKENVEQEAEYSSKSDFSKARLVYEAIQKCVEARGQEMVKGFWNVKLTKEGNPIKTWVSDTRQVFIGNVIALKSILAPEITSEKNYSKSLGRMMKKIREAKEENSYEEKIMKLVEGRVQWVGTGNKHIPAIGSLVVLPAIISPGLAQEINGGWDNKTNLYWDIVLQQYDLMFELLNRLINKLNYFKQKIGY